MRGNLLTLFLYHQGERKMKKRIVKGEENE
jgi:hypothetical protein